MSNRNVPKRPVEPSVGTIIIEDDDAMSPTGEFERGNPPDEEQPDIRDLLLDETD